MSEPHVPDRRPLVYAAMGILIVGIASILFWPRAAERGPDSLVLTPQDATAAEETNAIETALLASDDSVEPADPPADSFPVENAQLNEETVVEAQPEPVETKAETPPPPQPKPKKTAPATTSAAQPASAGAYLLNVGSFGERQNAEEMANRLEKEGIPARAVTAYANGKTIYRVQVGYFEGFSTAQAYGNQMKERAGIDFWVGQRE